MKRKPQVPAARNPFVALALSRKAGTHRKSNKALRCADRAQLVAVVRWRSAAGA
jgi:hypothetical protein